MLWYEKIWYGKSRWEPALLPFSYVYQIIVAARQWLYRMGLFHQHRVSVPVVVVGNLTIGGTGKTPLVISLVKWLKEQGEQPGIVTRGYHGKSKRYPLLVSPDSVVEEVGDEALIIARHTGCPVMVDPDRVRGAQSLLAQTTCSIIISDDGLQHTPLARDIEILVVDGQRRFGNGHCLPAGPLREPATRADHVDFVVCNGGEFSDATVMELEYGAITNLLDPTLKLQNWNTAQPVFAFTGIGNPKRFYDQLEYLGFNLRKHSFPDHYQYNPTDFVFTESAPVIMTEKDAVKCQDFAKSNWWYLPVSAQLPSSFWKGFSTRLQEVKEAKTSETKAPEFRTT